MKKFLLVISIFGCFELLPIANAQVNSGSNGSDGFFSPSQTVVIDMSDHPDGIYQYTGVSIPPGVTVTFKSNAHNTPVVWLVQDDCVIAGTIDIRGTAAGFGAGGGIAGPGGFSGASGGSSSGAGQGPGGGPTTANNGGNGSYCTAGDTSPGQPATPPGAVYGNAYILPLIGGSGGGGATSSTVGGAGGAGAILIAVTGTLTLNGGIDARGLQGCDTYPITGGSGSGGAVRLVATKLAGSGPISVQGGAIVRSSGTNRAGWGRVRLDILANAYAGLIDGASVPQVFTQGFQPIIIPAAGQGVQLSILSVAGNSVASNPSGVIGNPDVILPAQTTNPVPIVVSCTNVPLNSEIKVTVHPANGSDIQAVGLNNLGTASASTATISVNLPTGGGILYASAVTGINGGTGSNTSTKNAPSYSKTGLSANGERFTKLETKASLGGKQQQTLITASGKRYPLPN